MKAARTCYAGHRHPTVYRRHEPDGDVDLDVVGGVTMLSIKAVSNQLGQMLPHSPIGQGACLGKASIFEEISMLTWAGASSLQYHP